MNPMRIPLIAVICMVVAYCGVAFACHSQRGQVTDTWETANRSFKVRVKRYAEENGGFIAGAYYIFESAPVGSDNWSEVMTFRHDDPVEIPRDQVRFVNDEVGYVFMVYKYAVTIDGGRTWFTWYAVKDLPDWRNARPVIDDVQVDPLGIGRMKLTLVASESARATTLHTTDYGRHWSEK